MLECGAALQPRHATLTRVTASDGAAVVDEVVATFFPAPHSYTGEHVVEISGHGSPVLLQAMLKRAIVAGARLAEPGEFTLRSFLNGKRDLIQSEAVADLIDAATPLQARVAFDQLEGTLTQRITKIDAQLFDLIARLEGSLDFPDEGFHFIEPSGAAMEVGQLIEALDDLLGTAKAGRMVREGATVVISGRPNVGKSSIFNNLAGVSRAIVTPIPGTTRDLVTERVNIGGIAVTLVDTAGWRETIDVIESEGVSRGNQARGVADLVLLVLDGSKRLPRRRAIARRYGANEPPCRCRTRATWGPFRSFPSEYQTIVSRHPLSVSALTGAGFDELRRAIAEALIGEEAVAGRRGDLQHATHRAARAVPRFARCGARCGGRGERTGGISC
jgi:tRNA modification GTPase